MLRVVVLLVATHTVAAAPCAARRQPLPRYYRVDRADEDPSKNPVTASALAVVGTVVPLGVLAITAAMAAEADGVDNPSAARAVAFGVVMGGSVVLFPSAGHWYAGRFFTTGMAMRAVGVGMAVLGFAPHLGSDTQHTLGEIAVLSIGLGAVVDIATAAQEASRWNETNLSMVRPTAIRFHERGYGLGLAGSF